jgi:Methyltransferase domain
VISLQSEVDEAYRLALTYCADCRDYHLTRPYLVASGLRAGAAGDREVMAPLVREFVQAGARILVAGSADAGSLRFVLDEAGDRHPLVTVADRCQTPLLVCRHHAERRQTQIRTIQADLAHGDLGDAYDLIIAHAVLQFFPAADRTAFLTNLSGRLAPQGRLLLAYPLEQAVLLPEDLIDKVQKGIEERGVHFPNPPDILLEALRRMALAPARDFDGATLDLERLAKSCALRAERVVDMMGRRRTISKDIALPRPSRRYVIAARA